MKKIIPFPLSLFLSAFVLTPYHFVFAASPFEQCPTQAFLIQTPANTPLTYGVDLSIGSYALLSGDMGTTKVNGVGFNYADAYMYGWDYNAGTLAQFGADFQSIALNVSGLIGQQFYVGDVAVTENTWFGYRSKFGLYSIDLSTPLAPLTMVKVASNTTMGNPNITDFAFHPSDGMLYAVDNDGYLLRINPNNGSTETLVQVLNESEEGFNFVFGAQYFDVLGNLYISNNGNGWVWRISLNETSSEAVFFAYGPSSSSNDGARCALAPIETSDQIDFGDAPDSYGTSMESSGARHGLSGLYLGSQVDGETQAYTYPLSDNASDSSNDDDGVTFIGSLSIAELAIIQVEANTTGGYLNAWIDWDRDGSFNDDEKIASALALNQGSNTLNITVPLWASIGTSWARFRISSTSNIEATGGVADGEVEDYAVEIVEAGVSISYYPSANSFTSFAFEDQYPEMGDFDMNDVLMNMRITEYIKDNKVIRIRLEGQLAAMGASFRNGFAVQLPGVITSSIKGDSIDFRLNGTRVTDTFLENGQSNAVLLIADNLWHWVQAGENTCNYFRTETGCGTSFRPQWSMTIPFNNAIDSTAMPSFPYDPFIFASSGKYHGDAAHSITGLHPGRKYEVHLKNMAPTDTFMTNFYNSFSDASSTSELLFFLMTNGMPWALEMPLDWQHPLENVSILQAYPQFFDYATDSSGQTNVTWYLPTNANDALIFKD